MTTAKPKRDPNAPRPPEKKYGPFHAGVGLAVWLNQVCDESGTRYFRSVTINPRRYRDPKTGEWMDSSSFRVTDIPSLVLALSAAHEFMLSSPLPGEPVEEEVPESLVPDTDQRDIPM